MSMGVLFFFFQAEDGIRDVAVTGVQTCALPIFTPAGVDWVLVATLPAGVTVTRAPGIFGPWMREYVLGWCLAVTQRMETYRAAQRERRWREEILPDRLAGKTMTLVGLGDIGRTIAAAAR